MVIIHTTINHIEKSEFFLKNIDKMESFNTNKLVNNITILINIEYMYALSTGKDDASIVLKASDMEKAAKALTAKGVEIVTSTEIEAM